MKTIKLNFFSLFFIMLLCIIAGMNIMLVILSYDELANPTLQISMTFVYLSVALVVIRGNRNKYKDEER